MCRRSWRRLVFRAWSQNKDTAQMWCSPRFGHLFPYPLFKSALRISMQNNEHGPVPCSGRWTSLGKLGRARKKNVIGIIPRWLFLFKRYFLFFILIFKEPAREYPSSTGVNITNRINKDKGRKKKKKWYPRGWKNLSVKSLGEYLLLTISANIVKDLKVLKLLD